MALTRRATGFSQWTVRLICALALLFVGFAHQAPVITTSTGTVDVSQYILPDGTLPIFCITDNGDDGQAPGKMHMVHGCDTCQTTATILLPVPADGMGHAMQRVAAAATISEMDTFARPLYPPNTGPRAPPADPDSLI